MVTFVLRDAIDDKQFAQEFHGRRGVHIGNKADVKRAIHNFLGWNRLDLVDELLTFLKSNSVAAGIDATWLANIDLSECAQDRHNQIPKIAPGSRDLKHPWNEDFSPPPVQHALVIHKGAALAFWRAQPGHAFQGIVMLETQGAMQVRRRPKIFFIASQPSASEHTYAPRPHDASSRIQVYNVKTPPTVHAPKTGGQAGHTTLVQALNQNAKYGSVRQSGNAFIGFSIIKGQPPEIPNRYTFTSASSNFPHQKSSLNNATTRYVNTHWGKLITEACEKLSVIEHELSRQSDYLFMLNEMENAKARDSALWKFLKDRHWPDTTQSADTTQVDT